MYTIPKDPKGPSNLSDVFRISLEFHGFSLTLGNSSSEKARNIKTCQDVRLGCPWQTVTNL